MTFVDPAYAAWLKTDALYVNSTVAGAIATWGDLALDSKLVSPIAEKADAATEAGIQAAFLTGPLARDKHIVKGQRAALVGNLITIVGDRLGYEGSGALVFVVAAKEADTGDTTELTVLKRLYA